ncbi:MAG: hypothetical protein IPK78_15865 [Rhodospirillales bacterium]|nr:hypothetical protein [Rhodospirillales bacterium]
MKAYCPARLVKREVEGQRLRARNARAKNRRLCGPVGTRLVLIIASRCVQDRQSLSKPGCDAVDAVQRIANLDFTGDSQHPQLIARKLATVEEVFLAVSVRFNGLEAEPAEQAEATAADEGIDERRAD